MMERAPDTVIVAAWRPDGSFRILEGEEAEEAKARAEWRSSTLRSDGSVIYGYAVREEMPVQTPLTSPQTFSPRRTGNAPPPRAELSTKSGD